MTVTDICTDCGRPGRMIAKYGHGLGCSRSNIPVGFVTTEHEVERVKLATVCTLDDYQRLVKKFPGATVNELAGEMGKLIHYYKAGFDNISTGDRNAFLSELGDMLRHVSILASELGVNLSWVATLNLLKLRAGDNR